MIINKFKKYFKKNINIKYNLKKKNTTTTIVSNKSLKTENIINLNNNSHKIEINIPNVIEDKTEYIFIDFETANNNRTSACQIALIKVKQGKIIKKYVSLIKPPPLTTFTFTRIHNITANNVKNVKNFKQLWLEIVNFFTEKTIVLAHNARFDINVLRDLINFYKLQCPNFYYICTVELFRKTQTYQKNSLSFLASSNNISFQHHDALADVLTLHKLLNIHFSENYNLKDICNKKGIKINKLQK